jgi:isochorismate hydrolase
MKEAYFQPDTLQSLSSQWLEKYGRSKTALRQPFKIQNACLLILDMQRYFLDENSHAWVPSAEAIIPGLKKTAVYFRKAGRPVIATQHINTAENAGMMGSWWSELIQEDDPLVDIDPDLGIQPREILQKSQYDSFFGSKLESRLLDQNVKQVVIGGVMTHLCCDTTARAAFVRGFEVFFLVDGTATYNQDFHLASLYNLAHGVAVLTSTNRLIEG